MSVFPEKEGPFVLLFALMFIYITRCCVVRFVNFKMRSRLTAECFGHIFDDNLRNSDSKKFGVSAHSQDRLIDE